MASDDDDAFWNRPEVLQQVECIEKKLQENYAQNVCQKSELTAAPSKASLAPRMIMGFNYISSGKTTENALQMHDPYSKQKLQQQNSEMLLMHSNCASSSSLSVDAVQPKSASITATKQINTIEVPLCRAHGMPCNVHTTKKPGKNHGRTFWTCAMTREQKCQTFIWDDERSTSGCKIANIDPSKPLADSLPTSIECELLADDIIGINGKPPMSPFFEQVVKALCSFDATINRYVIPITHYESIFPELMKKALAWPTIVKVDAVPQHLLELLKINTNASINDLIVVDSDTQTMDVREPARKPKRRKKVAARDLDDILFDHARIPTELYGKLRPFQLESVKFVVEKRGRAFIADEMGLGKTVQAIALCAYYSKDWPVLVICPSSLRHNWENEILRFLPAVLPSDVMIVMNGKKPLSSNKLFFIISYDLVPRMFDQIEEFKFKIIVCDESHYIKSAAAKRTQACVPLLKKARRAILLSGTPALNRPKELFTQLHPLQPQVFPRFRDYGLRYCAGFQGRFGWEYDGAAFLDELSFLLKYCMIRRTKADVHLQLPAKIRQALELNVHVSKSLAKQLEVWNNMSSIIDQEFGVDSVPEGIGNAFLETGKAKLPHVLEYLSEALEGNDEKCLIFFHHKIVQRNIAKMLDKSGIPYFIISGDTPAAERAASVKNFQSSGSNIRVALLSILAGGTGFTLTAASRVIFAELIWTPALLVQAEDRVHRMTQMQTVHVVYLIGRNTLDDKIWPMLSKKLEILQVLYDAEHRVEATDYKARYLIAPGCTPIASEHTAIDDTSDEAKLTCQLGKHEPAVHQVAVARTPAAATSPSLDGLSSAKSYKSMASALHSTDDGLDDNWLQDSS